MRKGTHPRTALGQTAAQMIRRYYLHDVARDSAALTYYLLFAIFPLLIFVSTLLGILELDVDSIITGLRVNIALAMAGSIVGEFIASDRGLGRMIVYAGTTFDLKLVWVGVTVLSILSVLMYASVVLLEKVLMRHWRGAITE